MKKVGTITMMLKLSGVPFCCRQTASRHPPTESHHNFRAMGNRTTVEMHKFGREGANQLRGFAPLIQTFDFWAVYLALIASEFKRCIQVIQLFFNRCIP